MTMIHFPKCLHDCSLVFFLKINFMKHIYKIENIEDLGNLLQECNEEQLEDIIKSLSESLRMIYYVIRLGQSKDDICFNKWFWSPLDEFPSHLISNDDKVKNGFTIEVSKNKVLDE